MQPSDSAAPQQPRLLDQMRGKIRVKHYSIRTEHAYLDWVRRFILFHGKRHPAEMGATEVAAFLTRLAVVGNVAASTQNQAKSALLFPYREVLGSELPWLDGVESAKRASGSRSCWGRRVRRKADCRETVLHQPVRRRYFG